MSVSLLPVPKVVITGGLGGLGTTLALALRVENVPVTVIDALHPGCAPYPVFENRKAVLEDAGVEVRLQDMRLPDLPAEVLVPADRYESPLPPLWLHCAFPPPPDVPDVPLESYQQMAYDAPAQWIDYAMERGWWWMVMQHLPAVLSDDARLHYASWGTIFAAESKLRREFFRDVMRKQQMGLFPFLPELFGHHQSPHTMPLRQYLQILAGRDVSVCAFDKPWSVSSLDSTARDLLQVLQSYAASQGIEIEQKPNTNPDLLARGEDWILHLRVLLQLSHLRVKSDQSPGSYYPTDAIGQRLAQLPEFQETGFAILAAEEVRRVSLDDVRNLIAGWGELPWMPPPDWPRQVSGGRGRRKRKS
ncbi:hypothetical protein KQI52_07445 [bacterium]|nr:hypothetical protein [bacterium]